MSVTDIEGKTEREILILVYDRLGVIEDRQLRSDEKLSELESKQEGVDATLYGNGKVGLQEEHRALLKDFNQARRIFSWLTLSLGTLLAGMLFKLFTGEWSIAVTTPPP